MVKSESEKQCKKDGCGCTCQKGSKQPGSEYRKEDYDGCWAGTEEEEE